MKFTNRYTLIPKYKCVRACVCVPIPSQKKSIVPQRMRRLCCCKCIMRRLCRSNCIIHNGCAGCVVAIAELAKPIAKRNLARVIKDSQQGIHFFFFSYLMAHNNPGQHCDHVRGRHSACKMNGQSINQFTLAHGK